MIRRVLTIAIGVLAIGAPASSAATGHHVRHRYPFLSTARAKRAILRDSRMDAPRQVLIGRCYRVTRRHVTCWVIERGAMNLLSLDGAPAATDMLGWQDAVLRHGRIGVTIV